MRAGCRTRKTGMDRRVFFGRIAVGGAAAAAGLAGVRLFPAPALVEAQQQDAVLGEIASQMRSALRFLQQEPSGDALRQLASANRLLSAYGREKRFDDEVKARVRAAIRREGRSALSLPRFDVYEELTLRGFSVPPGVVMSVTPSNAAAALDRMSAAGITPYFDGLVTQFEAAAERLNRRFGRVQRIQTEEEDKAAQCATMRLTKEILELLVLFWCAPWMAGWYEICLVAMVELAAWVGLMWWEGCL